MLYWASTVWIKEVKLNEWDILYINSASILVEIERWDAEFSKNFKIIMYAWNPLLSIWMLSYNVVPLSHRFSCVLVTSSFAPEGHSCLCQQSPDKAPFVAQHVQDAPLPPPNRTLCACIWFVYGVPKAPPPPSLPEGHVLWFIVCRSFPQCSVLECTMLS